MDNKLYFYSNNIINFLFRINDFYEVSAKLKYISPDTIHMSYLRVYNTDNILIQRMFKIKNILND